MNIYDWIEAFNERHSPDICRIELEDYNRSARVIMYRCGYRCQNIIDLWIGTNNVTGWRCFMAMKLKSMRKTLDYLRGTVPAIEFQQVIDNSVSFDMRIRLAEERRVRNLQHGDTIEVYNPPPMQELIDMPPARNLDEAMTVTAKVDRYQVFVGYRTDWPGKQWAFRKLA